MGRVERRERSKVRPDHRTELSTKVIQAQLERILASRDFAHSDQLSRFLRFIVEQTIQGQAANLKEYRIGVEVFNRKKSFDPRTDPIVRVEARRLRSKLRVYYKTEGRHDPMLISLPKGRYVPLFRLRAPRIPPGILSPRKQKDLQVYNLYLKGRYFWNQHSPHALKRAIEYFEQAIAKDPSYALAHAGLADCYLAFALTGAQPPTQVMPKAKAAALWSLEIDDTLAEAHASLGLARALWDCDWLEAEKELQRAVNLNPGSAVAHQRYAFILGAMGRLDESMIEIRRAQELDPLSLIINTAMGMIFYCRRQYDRAIEEFSNTLELDPNYFLARLELGRAYGQKGAFEEAMAAFDEVRSLVGDNPLLLGSLGHFHALSGKRRKAQKLLDRLSVLAKQRYVSPTSMALIYIGLGEKDRAFKCLEKTYKDHCVSLLWLKVDPVYESLRSDPRFKVLLKKAGLVDRKARKR